MNQLGTLLFAVANFVILLVVLRKFLRTPVSEFFAKRHSDTHQYIENAHAKRLHVDAELQTLQARQQNLAQEFLAMRKQLETLSAHERELITKRADEQVEQISREAKLQVEQDALRIRQVLRHKILEQTFAEVTAELQKKSTEASQSLDAPLNFLGRQLKEPHAQVGGSV